MNVTKTLTHRDSLGWWLNDAGLIGQGVEVGCAEGKFSATILAPWKGQRLFLVDPWCNLPQEEYPQAHDTIDFEAWYQCCVALAANDSRATLIRKKSVDAARDFENGSLDFAYIDAAHDYANVLSDLDSWYPKVKPGGLLGGHDFDESQPKEGCCDVIQAVTRWMREHRMIWTVTPCSSWWCVK